MKAVAKIGNIQVISSKPKTTEQGVEYQSERVNIFFEVGDDVHMVQIFNSVFSGHTSEETLAKRNLFVGAIGEVTLRYGFRDWEGKRYTDVKLLEFVCANPRREPSSYPEGTPMAPASEVAAMMAEAAQEAEAAGDLPY